MTQDPTKSPAVSEREAIARIIAPDAFREETPQHARFYRNHSLKQAQHHALAAADAILARLAPAPEKGVREFVWLPIETVDRENGQRLVLRWDDCPNLPAHWETGRWSRTAGWVNTYGKPFSGEPTHWMDPDAALAQPEAARVGEEKLTYGHMPSYGRCDFRQIREAVSEATCGVREADDLDANTYPGHVMVSGINYNSLSRIVTAFVDAAASTPRNANETGQDEAEAVITVDGHVAATVAAGSQHQQYECSCGWGGSVYQDGREWAEAQWLTHAIKARAAKKWSERTALATQPAAGSEG